MAFSTILIGTLVVYVVYYAGNIIYDLFLSGASDNSRTEEYDEIEINESENILQPTSYISSPFISSQEAIEEVGTQPEEEKAFEGNGNIEIKAAMNGALRIDDIVSKIEQTDLTRDLDFLVQEYNNRH